MPSAYWYYGLGGISLVLLLVSILYRQNWKPLVLQINVAAIIHPFEVVVLILLNGYRYMPGFLQDAKLDNYLGSFMSNLVIIPALTVFINAFSLSWRYLLGIALVLSGIDWYFTTLGIYHHYWWKSVYTGIGFIILYVLSRWVWSGLQEKQPSLIFRLLIIYLTYIPFFTLILFLANRGGKLFRFQGSCFGDPEKCHQALGLLYLSINGIIITLCVGLRIRLRYRCIGIALILLINWIIGQYGIFEPRMAGISAHQLILVPVAVVPIVIIIFRLAKLDYLFP
jgi:hypothetical protein